MKKLIRIITLCVIMTMLCATAYATEYIDGIEFDEVKIQSWQANWSGKENITDQYPPQISVEDVNFTEVIGSDDVKKALNQASYAYVWTGNDYLVYEAHHPYTSYKIPKYLYRISADFQTLLNKYEVPNWIDYMAFADGGVYIATSNVIPVYSDTTETRVNGARQTDFKLYYSDDCTEWTQIKYNDYKSYDVSGLCIHNAKDNVFIYNTINSDWSKVCYLYSNGNASKILYENNKVTSPRTKIGEFICNIYGDNTIGFSCDGIYWAWYNTAIEHIAQGLETKNGFAFSSAINTSNFYICDKEELFNKLREKLPQNPVYVKLDGNYLGFEQPPVIEDGRTLVPMRFIFEQMGAEVNWNGETRSVTATKDGMTVTLAIDDANAAVNGSAATLDVPARLINDKTMIPLRFLSENLGYTVDWDGETRTAIIRSDIDITHTAE